MCKKRIFLLLFCLIILAASASPLSAKAINLSEVASQIAKLKKEAARLWEQVVGLQAPKKAVWCHNFKVDLKYGDRGTEVKSLQRALIKERFKLGGESRTSYFGKYTASAVVQFQEKYEEDILVALGLDAGTGVVDQTTRTKLNQIWGCELTTPRLTLLAPNGGEIWVRSQTYNITWASSEIEKINIVLEEWGPAPFPFKQDIAEDVSAALGKYSWAISTSTYAKLSPDSSYKIKILDSTTATLPSNQQLFDSSDRFFKITTAEACHTSLPWSWNYCSPVCKCETGQGDCDSDIECLSGYCGLDVGTQYGQFQYIDVCQNKPNIEILSPNGGETWYIGDSHSIVWKAEGVNKFNVILLPDNTYLDRGVPFSGAGKISWHIGRAFNLTPGKYKIKVVNADNLSIFDESDDYFTLESKE